MTSPLRPRPRRQRLGLGKCWVIHSVIISAIVLPDSTARIFNFRCVSSGMSMVRRFIGTSSSFFCFPIHKRLGTLNPTRYTTAFTIIKK
jgi:hypothetical protein